MTEQTASTRPDTGIRHIVLTGIEHSRLGGVCTFMNTMAHGFLGRGYDVEIIGMQPTPEDSRVDFHRDPRIRETTIHDQIPPKWVRVRRRDRYNPAVRRRYRQWEEAHRQAVDRLRPLVAGWGPETLIVSTQIFPMEHLLPAGLECGRPGSPYVIAQYHASRAEAVRLGSTKRLHKNYTPADRLLALTPEDARQFQAFDQMNNTGWILNPLPPSQVREVPRANEVISLGRYDKNKALGWLIRAWAVLAPEFPDWRLRLYGEGDERSHLQEMIDENNLGDCVSLEGITTDPEGALERAKIHAMTSQHEGLPMSIAEAARAGVPTVTFDSSPGIRTLIDSGEDGLVIARNHLTDLIASLRRLMSDDDERRRMGEHARERSHRFDLDTVLNQWEHEMRLLTGATPDSVGRDQ